MSTKNDAGESRKAKIPQEMGKSVKKFTRQSWINLREYIFITFGLFIYAVAWKAFLLPHQITGGGVTGIGALFYYAANIPISVTYFSINAVLLLISIKSIGLNLVCEQYSAWR